MIITCPDCSAKYKVRDELIPSQGKKVRCKKCETVFRAFVDGRMISERVTEAAKAPAPAPSPASEIPATTVRIDADQIQKMVDLQRAAGGLNQPATSPAPAEPAPPVPPGPVFDEPVHKAPDEPLIDPFAPNSADPDPFDDDGPGDRFGTVQMRVSDNLAAERPKTPDSPLASEFDSLSFDSQDDDHQSEANQFQFDLENKPDMSFEDELSEPPAPESHATQAMPAMTNEPQGFPAIGETADPFNGQSPVPVAQPPQKPAVKTFQALIENTPYPNLPLDVVERWIKEGRLLESDQVSAHGSDAYQRADQYPELVGIFNKYYGDSRSESSSPKKKGFFARLFGR